MMDEASIMNTLGALLNQQAQNYERQLQVILERLSIRTTPTLSETPRERPIPKLNVPNINELGRCKMGKYSIQTSTEQPIFIRPYKKSLRERTLIQEEINKMLRARIIRESKSSWSFPVVLINKPDGTFRFCTDYRELNKITPQDPFPLPRIDDIMDRISGSKWFSTLDLKSGPEEDAIYKRAIEIRDLIEDTRPAALEKIKQSQVRQEAAQNRAHNISHPWAMGTQVFLKNSRLGGKLKTKYTGPYKIIGTTPNGNYWLETSTGSKLSTSYPISKLKKTSLQILPQNSYEVEKILDHKIRNGQIHYFVKWKNYGIEDCTWEPEPHFETPECIADYWTSKAGVIEDDDCLRAGTC